MGGRGVMIKLENSRLPGQVLTGWGGIKALLNNERRL